MEQHYAIVFTRDFAPGEHWTDHLPKNKAGEKHVHGKHRAADDDSDRKQHWKAGDLYSVGTVIDRSKLPAHLEVIEIDGPQNGRQWNAEQRRFVGHADHQ